jgi:ion channel-forming bestrophin family protein
VAGAAAQVIRQSAAAPIFEAMIAYNTKEWFGIFRLHKADTFRKLMPLMAFVCIYTLAVVYIEHDFLHLSEKSSLKNLPVMHTLLGFAISMLLVFRTNTAYDRWWEGRRLWGSLVNTSRNLAIKMEALLPAEDRGGREFFATLIPHFAVTLKSHLRSRITEHELDEFPHPEIPGFDTSRHVPSQVAGLMTQKLNTLYREGVISGEQLLFVNGELSAFLDICGACERIRNTPIPFSYSAFIKKFIFAYVITMPFGFMFNLGYLAVPVVVFIFYVLASLEAIAEEIEDPFGFDENDLPLEKLCETITKTVREVLV